MKYLTTEQAARLADITPSSLRARRRREPDHPRTILVGQTALYDAAAFEHYLSTWIDGRTA